MKKILDFSLKHSWLVVLAFLVVSAFMGIGVTRLKINYSTESFMPEENPVIKKSRQIDASYNTGKAVIAVLYASDVFAPDRLASLLALTDDLAGIDGVVRVVSLANTHRMSEVDGTLISSELVPADSPNLSPGEIAKVK